MSRTGGYMEQPSMLHRQTPEAAKLNCKLVEKNVRPSTLTFELEKPQRDLASDIHTSRS